MRLDRRKLWFVWQQSDDVYSVFLRGGVGGGHINWPTTVPRVHRRQTLMASGDNWPRGGANTADGSREGDEAPTGTAVLTCECVSPPWATQNVWHKSLNRGGEGRRETIQKADVRGPKSVGWRVSWHGDRRTSQHRAGSRAAADTAEEAPH